MRNKVISVVVAFSLCGVLGRAQDRIPDSRLRGAMEEAETMVAKGSANVTQLVEVALKVQLSSERFRDWYGEDAWKSFEGQIVAALEDLAKTTDSVAPNSARLIRERTKDLVVSEKER